MNIPLLRKVQSAILAEPEKFDMSAFFRKAEKPECGTTACIGGWAIALSKNRMPSISMDNSSTNDDRAERLLGLSCEQGWTLLYDRWWPEPFRKQYKKAQTAKQRAEIAAKRIGHFIATEGRE